MKRDHQSSQLRWVVLSLGIGIGTGLLLCAAAAGLISSGVIPQNWDPWCGGVALAIGTIAATRVLCQKGSGPRWVAVVLVAGVYLALMLTGNLLLSELDLGLFAVNTGIVIGCGLLSILRMPKGKRSYRVRY